DIKINSQRIENIRIYWNEYADSADIAINNRVGTFSKMLEDIEEKEHIFNLVSFDKFGNKSLPFEVVGTVYGDRFQSGLTDRTIQTASAENDGTTINWGGMPDNAISCELAYTDNEGHERILRILSSENSTLIPDTPSSVRWRTLFLPETTAIDTFYTHWRALNYIPYKYSTEGWTAESRNGNHGWGAAGGEPYKVLDGDLNTGWHSKTGTALPQCLVVDMKSSRSVDHIVLWSPPGNLDKGQIYFKTIEVYLSDAPVTPDVYQTSWGTAAARYEWPGGFDGITINLAPNSQGQYMILYFPDSRTNTYISFAELYVYGG
ncbi:MAG: discoidin domain-containing protein, partial [Tannerella sp.]|nr:discoidin domain-containing protein [Tannerella sp.]